MCSDTCLICFLFVLEDFKGPVLILVTKFMKSHNRNPRDKTHSGKYSYCRMFCLTIQCIIPLCLYVGKKHSFRSY